MSAKKNLIITLSTLCVVVVAAVLTVTLVLAYAGGSLTSSINVGYTAESAIKGTITATYTIKNSEETTLHDPITFSGEESGDQLNKTPSNLPENITLTKDNDNVVFKYNFTADTSFTATKNGYTATLSFVASENGNKNVKIEVSTDGVSYNSVADLSNIGSVSVLNSSGTSLYVRVSILQKLNDASFAGSFKWNLAPN